MAKNNTSASAENSNPQYNRNVWMIPNKRAKGFADEMKSKVHMKGPKVGNELTDVEKGFRSGYFLAQKDHAGVYKYNKALGEGKTPAEAAIISQTPSKKKK